LVDGAKVATGGFVLHGREDNFEDLLKERLADEADSQGEEHGKLPRLTTEV